MTPFSIYESVPVGVYCVVLAALLGAALGSFLNCAAWRIAHRESFVRGRSRCPQCGHVLGAADLVPVFSWLLLRGRCRYCKGKIPARYVLAELCFAAITVCNLLHFDLTPVMLRNLVFLCCLFCLSLVDLEIYEIPDGCLLVALLAWFAALPFTFTRPLGRYVLVHVLSGLGLGGAILLLALIMDRVLRRESMGGGDIKLFALVGLYLGALGGLLAVLLSCLFGLAFAALGRKGRNAPFPFGPAIAAAAVVTLFWGDGVVAWYLSLF